MKKRILASSMASVMALSAAGTSLVSFADVDAAYKDVVTVTKAELRKFMETKRIADLGDNEAADYGNVSAERFMKAYDYANYVLDTDFDDAEQEAASITAAFNMVKAAEAKLIIRTSKELAALVEQYRPTYNTENRLNPNSTDNEDLIYNAEKWGDFEGAFETAEDNINSSDSRDITDAYEELEKTYKDLVELKKVTKSEVVKAFKAYGEALRDTQYKYENWQRGTLKASGTVYNNRQAAWGAIYSHCESGYDKIEEQYKIFIGAEIPKTTNDLIVAAYDAMVMATTLLTKFEPDTMISGSSKKVESLLSDYWGQLIYTYGDHEIRPVISSFYSVASTVSNANPKVKKGTDTVQWANLDGTETAGADQVKYWYTEVAKSAEYKILNLSTSYAKPSKKNDCGDKRIAAECTVKHSGATMYYVVDKTKTLLNGNHPIVSIGEAEADNVASADGVYFKATQPSVTNTNKYLVVSLAKNKEFVISDYVGLTLRSSSRMYDWTGDPTNAELSDVRKVKPNAMKFGSDTWNACYAAMNNVFDEPDGAIGYHTSATDVANGAALGSASTDAPNNIEAKLSDPDDKPNSLMQPDWSTLLFDCDFNPGETGANALQTVVYLDKALAIVDELINAPLGAELDNGVITPIKSTSNPNAVNNWWYNAAAVDTNNTMGKDEPEKVTDRPTSNAWKLAYNYLAYALSDAFDASAKDEYTKKQVKEYIDKAYDLAEKTADTIMLQKSHKALVDARADANDWYALAVKDRIKDSDKTTKPTGSPKNATDICGTLKSAYDQLNKELAGFKYSYGDILEIANDAAKTSEKLTDKAAAKKIKDAIAPVMLGILDMSTELQSNKGAEIDVEYVVFDDDGSLYWYNRVLSSESSDVKVNFEGVASAQTLGKTNSYNKTHKTLMDAVAALEKAVDDATKEPDKPTITNDVDGNGKFEMADLTKMLQLYADGKTEVAKHDFNGDGKVDMADLTKLLQNYADRT